MSNHHHHCPVCTATSASIEKMAASKWRMVKVEGQLLQIYIHFISLRVKLARKSSSRKNAIANVADAFHAHFFLFATG